MTDKAHAKDILETGLRHKVFMATAIDGLTTEEAVGVLKDLATKLESEKAKRLNCKHKRRIPYEISDTRIISHACLDCGEIIY